MGPERHIDPAALRHELERVLQSRVFEKAQRSQRFLCYLVEAALADPPTAVKEYTIAIDVFDRDSTYDPSVDATVRVEASRLRSRLREYYGEQGRDDPWHMEVPKGSYSIVVTPNANPAQTPVSTSSLVPESAEPGPAIPAAYPKQSHWIRIAAVLLLLIIGGSAAAWHYRRKHRATASATPRQFVSLAILPIANHTNDPHLNLIADGLTDDMIRELSQVPALHLIARTTMFRYRGHTADAEAIARALHVDTVLTAELHHAGDHTSLAVELTDVADGSVILSRDYIADGHDLPTAQADVQRDLLDKLHLESSALDPGRTLHSVTSSPEAYHQFLDGEAIAATSAPPDLHEAIMHFEKAVALDPRFDLAWAALGSAHLFLGVYFEPPREQMPLARKYAEEALTINPSLGEAHGTLGLIHLLYDWDPSAAESEMSTAGAQTAAIGTLTCTAHLMERAGRSRNAEEIVSRRLTYDPQSAALIAELGCVDFYRGNYDSALRHYRDALISDPQSPVAYWGMGKTLNAQGHHAEAIKTLRSFKERNGFEPPIITAETGYALGASGQRAAALDVIRELSTPPATPPGSALPSAPAFIDPYFTAIIYLALSQSPTASPQDLPNAFIWLNKALDARSSFAISILTEPKWQAFQRDSRYQAAVQRMFNKKA